MGHGGCVRIVYIGSAADGVFIIDKITIYFYLSIQLSSLHFLIAILQV